MNQVVLYLVWNRYKDEISVRTRFTHSIDPMSCAVSQGLPETKLPYRVCQVTCTAGGTPAEYIRVEIVSDGNVGVNVGVASRDQRMNVAVTTTKWSRRPAFCTARSRVFHYIERPTTLLPHRTLTCVWKKRFKFLVTNSRHEPASRHSVQLH